MPHGAAIQPPIRAVIFHLPKPVPELRTTYYRPHYAGFFMEARMQFGSVCSGIEAASVAWHPLGWKAAWLSEIDPFPCAVLAHHYPGVPNLGDMTKIADRVRSGEIEAPDVFCGGTPCQAFSVAGLRKSLDDARGNLSLTFCEIANEIDAARSIRGKYPTIIFWENVPGVLNTKDNAFGCFLAGLAGEDDPLIAPGGKWTNAGCVFGPKRTVAWRVLDAQYFGVAQRRRRVFVIASARDGFDPAKVLFEFDGVRRDTAPSREARKVAAASPANSVGVGGQQQYYACGGIGSYHSSSASATLLKTGQDLGQWCEAIITMAHGQGGAEIATDRSPTLTCNHEAPIAAYGIPGNWIGRKPENGGNAVEPMHNVAPCLTSTDRHGVAVGADCYNGSLTGDVACTMGTPGSSVNASGPTVMVPIGFPANLSGTQCVSSENLSPALGAVNPTAVAFTSGAFFAGQGAKAGSVAYSEHVAPTLKASDSGTNRTPSAHIGMQVRRLTPTECERLQGFPDGYTLIPWKAHQAWAKKKGTQADGRSFEEWLIETTGRGLRQPTTQECPDGPRYKALGNSWAVPVVRWIGERICSEISKPRIQQPTTLK